LSPPLPKTDHRLLFNCENILLHGNQAVNYFFLQNYRLPQICVLVLKGFLIYKNKRIQEIAIRKISAKPHRKQQISATVQIMECNIFDQKEKYKKF